MAMVPVSPPDARSQQLGQQSGIASVYGYLGEMTASGEQLIDGALTAAHPSLPLGSFAMVTNELNGRSVVVRINDRGPFVAGRIIDVTVAVAQVLGLDGLGPVRVTPFGKSSFEISRPTIRAEGR
jgi:rare lipoprotein A